MWTILASSSLSMHRERQDDLAGVRRRGVEEVALGADASSERGDELLADGVERRVGHLREELGEVVEDEPRALGEHGERGVGAHRAERLGAGAGHRRDEDLQLLLGVAEGPLAAGDRGRRVDDVLALGQVGELDEAGVQPLLVGLLARQRGLDLVVADDPAGGGVDEEHPARLEPPAAHDVLGLEVEHARLGGEDDQAVVGDPVAAGAQAVAVEHRADHRAVGEGDAGRPVPRLHERRVELVERPAGRVHRLVVLPRLGDHHQHRVRQRAAAEVEQLEHLVEGRRVGRPRGADREDALEVAGDDVRA